MAEAGEHESSERTTAERSDIDVQAEIDALRAELTKLSEHAKSYAGQAAKMAKNTTRDGVALTKTTIRRHPVITLAAAIGAGALLANLIASRRIPQSRYQHVKGYLSDLRGYDMSNYNLSNLSSTIERAVQAAQPREHVSSTVDKIANAARDTKLQEGLEKTAERAMSWWDSTRKKVANKSANINGDKI